jgi:hypothetical protein
MPPTDQYPELPGLPLILDMSDTINDLKLVKYREPKQVIDDAVDALLGIEVP